MSSTLDAVGVRREQPDEPVCTVPPAESTATTVWRSPRNTVDTSSVRAIVDRTVRRHRPRDPRPVVVAARGRARCPRAAPARRPGRRRSRPPRGTRTARRPATAGSGRRRRAPPSGRASPGSRRRPAARRRPPAGSRPRPQPPSRRRCGRSRSASTPRAPRRRRPSRAPRRRGDRRSSRTAAQHRVHEQVDAEPRRSSTIRIVSTRNGMSSVTTSTTECGECHPSRSRSGDRTRATHAPGAADPARARGGRRRPRRCRRACGRRRRRPAARSSTAAGTARAAGRRAGAGRRCRTAGRAPRPRVWPRSDRRPHRVPVLHRLRPSRPTPLSSCPVARPT